MKQIELDQMVETWFAAANDVETLESRLSSARCHLSNVTTQIATRLLPSVATPEQRWVFPSTGGRIIVAYKKKKTACAEGSGEAVVTYEPTVEEHIVK